MDEGLVWNVECLGAYSKSSVKVSDIGLSV